MPNNDLISRSELWKKFDEAHLFDDGNPRHIAQQIVEEAPAVDAAPVVHGFNTYDHNSAFQCSVCDFSDWDTMTADSGKYNYCPNCGAKMDGAKDG